MAQHNALGVEGENLAVSWLQQKGFRVVHRNWRHAHYEIDIVASKENKLHFIEVKTRHQSPFGNPEDSVTRKKFRALKRAADEFLHLNPGHPWIQYDILSITLYKGKPPEYFLLEDVFL